MKNKYTLLFLPLLLLFSTVYPQQTIIVDAKTVWQNTGIFVSQSDTILFTAQGSWSNAGTDFLSFNGPEGVETWHSNPSNFLVQGVNHMSLVGKIGENGVPFGIGSHRSITFAEGGTLYLSMNDRPNQFSDNYGYLVVGIYKIVKPITAVESELNNNIMPSEISLDQNYPNPFNPTTKINFQVSELASISIDIYDINGQLVKRLMNDYRDAGNYSVIWDGKNDNNLSVSSGTYFYQLTVGNFTDTKKMILLK